MPPLPSDDLQPSEPSNTRPLRTNSSHNRPSKPSPASESTNDKTIRLQQSIDELRSLLSQKDDIRFNWSELQGATPTAEKRRYDQIVALDEITSQGSSRSRPRGDGLIPLTADSQTFGPRSFYLHPMQSTNPEVAPPTMAQAAAQPTMRLENCASGSCYLPPPAEGSALLNEYLHDFNSRIPLFDPETVYNYVRDCYSGKANQYPLTWVLAYIPLGIGHRLRAMSLFAATDDTTNAEFYLNKCLAVLPDLLLQEPNLQLVQAVLGVSILLQTSTRSQRAAPFVSTAMRMAQEMAYNEALQEQDEELSKDKVVFYVFWIAFIMDTAMNLRGNRPNTQKLVDINVPLPNPSMSELSASITSETFTMGREVNVFALHASLAIIQAEALEELFSIRARQRPAILTVAVFESVITKLGAWRMTNPLADSDAPSIPSSIYQSDVVHSIILEASYFETLYQLHAGNVLGAFTRRLDVLSPDALRSAAGQISGNIFADAQRLLEFATLVPQGNVSVTWITMNAQVAALCTALAHHIPKNGLPGSEALRIPNVAANMLLYSKILSALEIATAQAKDTDLPSKIDVCRHLLAQVQDELSTSQT
ncbi:Nn.00g066310.m01.CDS01 [Neocucurbitaria sp. VM-36]